ncbi:MAG: hypothetical protein ACP5O7_12565 [Phycisphaerae bacterium]
MESQENDPRLAYITAAWARLPEPLRAGLAAMVRAFILSAIEQAKQRRAAEPATEPDCPPPGHDF